MPQTSRGSRKEGKANKNMSEYLGKHLKKRGTPFKVRRTKKKMGSGGRY